MRLVSALVVSLLFSLGCAEAGRDPAPDAGDAGPLPDGSSLDAGSSGGLVVPSSIELPYRVAGSGGSSASATITNEGDASVVVTFVLTGDARFHLTVTPAFVPAHTSAQISISFDGAASQSVAIGALAVTASGVTQTIAIHGAVGGVGLPVATYDTVNASDGRLCGTGTTIAMPGAPFPDPSGVWTDASVRIFVPESYRDRGTQDVALHFHGHNTTLANTLAGHRYQQHVCASGVNTILVVPQGPVSAASGNFGKLMTPAKTAALLEEVLIVLFRDAKIRAPVLGELVLTSHSGGYQAAAVNTASSALPTRQVDLFDSLYGSITSFEDFATAHGTFRSNYTSAGGTLANNQALVTTLESAGILVSENATFPALRDVESVIYFADTAHDSATRIENAYGEQLRFGAAHHRRGARIELRSALATGGTADIAWLAPADADRTGFVVESSFDGIAFDTVASVAANVANATFTMTGTRWVRVRSIVAGVANATTQLSDTYSVTDDSTTLVVDTFERVLGGSYSGLEHDFAARVGTRIGASTISHRALVEDGFSLAPYTAVVWLAGDQSIDDHPVSDDEQGILTAYVSGGGHLVVSGSEVTYTLNGDSFLGVLGAAYAADDANSLTVSGTGPLAALGSLGFAGVNAPYPEEYPDRLGVTGGGVVLLQYAPTGSAAVGIAGKAALVGFPLELVDPAKLTSLLEALLTFVGAP